jgi:hypothetical protein
VGEVSAAGLLAALPGEAGPGGTLLGPIPPPPFWTCGAAALSAFGRLAGSVDALSGGVPGFANSGACPWAPPGTAACSGAADLG